MYQRFILGIILEIQVKSAEMQSSHVRGQSSNATFLLSVACIILIDFHMNFIAGARLVSRRQTVYGAGPYGLEARLYSLRVPRTILLDK